MSYLLDSLKKSEKERRENHSSSSLVMRSPAFLENDTPKTPFKLLVIILLCLMLLFIAYLAFSLLNTPKDSNRPIESSVARPDQAVSSEEATLSAKESAIALYNEVLSSNTKTDIDSLYDEIQNSSLTDSSSPTKVSVSAKNKAPPSVSEPPTSELSNSEPSSPTSTEQGDSSLVTNSESATESAIEPEIASLETEAAVSNEPNIPSIYDIDAYVRKDIPSIDYGAHIYATDNNSGFVILDGARRRAGDRLESGLFVEKIEEENVVLNFNGVLFTLPAMKSWQGR